MEYPNRLSISLGRLDTSESRQTCAGKVKGKLKYNFVVANVRYETFDRFDFQCVWCGNRSTNKTLCRSNIYIMLG